MDRTGALHKTSTSLHDSAHHILKKFPNCIQQLIPNLCVRGLNADCPFTQLEFSSHAWPFEFPGDSNSHIKLSK
jgi:spore coat polysaccharide biosynthesis protein SpsF (cytidylyltransferase family)